MRYYLFLDESGDHGLSKIDPSFPVFVLCGIIASIINKPSYIKKYGKKKNDVYEVALSVEDNKLKSHFPRVYDVGTYYVETAKIKEYKFGIHFRDKLQNIYGLQLSDLIAYPIARWAMDPKRAIADRGHPNPKMFYNANI